jgi:hypothetical protein
MSVIDSKKVKTRKEHHCCGCSRKFPKGSKLERVTGTDGDNISSVYWCDVCLKYWDKYMSYDDEIGFGELRSEDRERWEEIRKSVESVIA